MSDQERGYSRRGKAPLTFFGGEKKKVKASTKCREHFIIPRNHLSEEKKKKVTSTKKKEQRRRDEGPTPAKHDHLVETGGLITTVHGSSRESPQPFGDQKGVQNLNLHKKRPLTTASKHGTRQPKVTQPRLKRKSNSKKRS